jgi:uncharacterized protein YpmB
MGEMQAQKSAIFQKLLEKAQVVSLYKGGGDESQIIVFRDSEDRNLLLFIESLSNEIVQEIQKAKR